LPQRETSYSSLASWTLHARVGEVAAVVVGAARPFVAVLIYWYILANR
jgi:hypothetical protein